MSYKNDYNEFPYQIKDVEPKLVEELKKHFHGEITGYVQVGPKGYFLPHEYKQEALNLYNMKIRHSDIFVTGYPRSGTTWTQELVWLVANNLDYAKADATPLKKRYPFLEVSAMLNPIVRKCLMEANSHSEHKLQKSGMELLSAMSSPRFLKTHLPISLLPPSLLDVARVVYVARDPRDVAVSYYHYNRLLILNGYIGDFKTFWKYFVNDLRYWSPYFEHLKEAWEKRHHPNMLFLVYERISKDLPNTVRRVADFFDKKFTDDQIYKLCDHLSIENFRNNKSVNSDDVKELGLFKSDEEDFIRKGKVGGWRDYFDDEMAHQAEEWIACNLKDTDFRFTT